VATTLIASETSNVATYQDDEKLLIDLVDPFLQPSQKASLDTLTELLPRVRKQRAVLFSRGLGPILVRAYNHTVAARTQQPEQPSSLYESLGQSGISMLPGDLASTPATEDERIAFYRELLAYEKLAQEKVQSINALEPAIATSILR